jgi:hypothetical protein
MNTATPSQEPLALTRLRRFLLAILAVGQCGTLMELLLLGHFESIQQWIPIGLLGVGTLVVAWHAVMPRPASVRALQLTMALFLTAGAVGIGLHYDGNAEFEREMTPAINGVALVKEAMTGATPVMAPGAMGLLGFIGLAYTYRHPLVTTGDSILLSER